MSTCVEAISAVAARAEPPRSHSDFPTTGANSPSSQSQPTVFPFAEEVAERVTKAHEGFRSRRLSSPPASCGFEHYRKARRSVRERMVDCRSSALVSAGAEENAQERSSALARRPGGRMRGRAVAHQQVDLPRAQAAVARKETSKAF